jgi:hypothetical protein
MTKRFSLFSAISWFLFGYFFLLFSLLLLEVWLPVKLSFFILVLGFQNDVPSFTHLGLEDDYFHEFLFSPHFCL